VARPTSVDGGRPHRTTIRWSDKELAALNKARGGLSIPDYIRNKALPKYDPVILVTNGERITEIDTRDTPAQCPHQSWYRAGTYLDKCHGCGAERPHQAGTR